MNFHDVLLNEKWISIFSQYENKEVKKHIENIIRYNFHIKSQPIEKKLKNIGQNLFEKYSAIIFHDGIQDKMVEKILKKINRDAVILINKDLASSPLIMLNCVEFNFNKIITYGHLPKSDYRVISTKKREKKYESIVEDKDRKKHKFYYSAKENDFLLTLSLILFNKLLHSNKELPLSKHFSSKKNIKKFKIKDEPINILFLGDTSFGENYQDKIEKYGGDNILKTNGYYYSLEKMKPLMTKSNFIVCNLETPITDIKKSPYSKIKDYIHWTDVNKAPKTLIDHNVGVISLANNHVFDFATDGFHQTIAILNKNKLPFIGAGKNINEAARPFILDIEYNNHHHCIAIISAFEKLKNYDKKYNVYASKNSPGLMPLDIDLIAEEIKSLKSRNKSTFVIIFPHWGSNYKFRDTHQLKSAHALIKAGADLIIGHGSHMAQEFDKINNKWALFSIGNFMFNSRGRYKKLGAPPYSMVAKLLISPDNLNNSLKFKLKIYPIITNNLITNYQPRFLKENEFNDFCKIFSSKTINKKTYIYGLPRGQDKFGHYLSLDIKNNYETILTPNPKYIGFIAKIYQVKNLNEYIFLWMHRAMVIDRELIKHGYKLLCYTPIDIDKDKKTVTGYIYQNGQFLSTVSAIPKINYDWYLGPIWRKNSNGIKYKKYYKWADKHKKKIFPSHEFKNFTKDKLEIYKKLFNLDENIVPYTELFEFKIDQLKRFIKNYNRIFIKPREGKMGNGIIVIYKKNDNFFVKHYFRRNSSSNIFSNLEETLDFLKKKSSYDAYIIQQAIDCIVVSDSVFDIRVIMLSNGVNWKSISEIRIGAKGSDLSNVSQGGINKTTKKTLLNFLSEKETNSLIDRVNLKAKKIANHLIKEFKNSINEFSIDFIVDNKLNIAVAELNAKPGLSGMPELFNDFHNMSQQEKFIYNTYTIPHGKILAQFLINAFNQYSTLL